MRYWLNTRGQVEGPYDETTLLRMLEAGEVSSRQQVCPEGTEHWNPIGSYPAFAVTVASARGNDLKDAPGLGWRLFIDRYGIVLGVAMIATIVSALPSIVTVPLQFSAEQFASRQDGSGLSLLMSLLANCITFTWSFLVATPVAIGGLWVLVRLHRGHHDAGLKDFVQPFRRYGAVLLGQLLLNACFLCLGLAGLLVAAIVAFSIGFVGKMVSFAGPGENVGGVIMFVGLVTGSILFMLVMLWGFARLIGSMILLVDDDVGPLGVVEALKRSWQVTSGHGASLIVLFMACGVIVMLSVLLFCVGLFFLGIPLYMSIIAVAYALLFPAPGKAS